LRRAAKDGIGSFLWRATLQTCGLCDWKCIFLQWIAGSISGHSSAFDSNLANVYAVSGRQEEAIKIAKDLEAQHDQNPSAEANIALIYLGLGDQDQAMIWLNKGYEARFNPSILLRPAFDPLRSDAQFKDLLRRVGLPG